MNSRRIAAFGTIGLILSVLLLVDLAPHGGLPPGSNGIPTTTIPTIRASGPLRILFPATTVPPTVMPPGTPSTAVTLAVALATAALIGVIVLRLHRDRQLGTAVVLSSATLGALALVVVFRSRSAVALGLIWVAIAIIGVAYVRIRRNLMRGLPQLAALLGLVALVLVLLELRPTSGTSGSPTSSIPRCAVRGHTIDVDSNLSCSFVSAYHERWTFVNRMPANPFFRVVDGRQVTSKTTPKGFRYQLELARCASTSCTANDDAPMLGLGSTAKSTTSLFFVPRFAGAVTFVDDAPGTQGWASIASVTFDAPPAAKLPEEEGSASWSLLTWISIGIASLLFVATLVLLVSRFRWRKRASEEQMAFVVSAADTDSDEVFAEAADLLDDVADPREAILRCWLELERLVRARGLERTETETADELTARLIGRSGAAGDELVGLHDLYLTARFSTRSFDETDRDSARRQLFALREVWIDSELLATS